jgi:hypothetical protein
LVLVLALVSALVLVPVLAMPQVGLREAPGSDTQNVARELVVLGSTHLHTHQNLSNECLLEAPSSYQGIDSYLSCVGSIDASNFRELALELVQALEQALAKQLLALVLVRALAMQQLALVLVQALAMQQLVLVLVLVLAMQQLALVLVQALAMQQLVQVLVLVLAMQQLVLVLVLVLAMQQLVLVLVQALAMQQLVLVLVLALVQLRNIHLHTHRNWSNEFLLEEPSLCQGNGSFPFGA